MDNLTQPLPVGSAAGILWLPRRATRPEGKYQQHGYYGKPKIIGQLFYNTNSDTDTEY